MGSEFGDPSDKANHWDLGTGLGRASFLYFSKIQEPWGGGPGPLQGRKVQKKDARPKTVPRSQ